MKDHKVLILILFFVILVSGCTSNTERGGSQVTGSAIDSEEIGFSRGDLLFREWAGDVSESLSYSMEKLGDAPSYSLEEMEYWGGVVEDDCIGWLEEIDGFEVSESHVLIRNEFELMLDDMKMAGHYSRLAAERYQESGLENLELANEYLRLSTEYLRSARMHTDIATYLVES